jgi:hypothetical protein
MVYVRNVPSWERAARLVIGLAVLGACLAVAPSPVYRWIGIASGIGIVLTAVFGFCPACALVGRRL